MLRALCVLALAAAATAVLPILPMSIADTWTPARPGGLYYGDTRAVVELPPSFTGPIAAAQVFWRRRDPNPSVKEVIVVSAATQSPVSLINATIENTCGLVYFSAPAGAGTYWVYYLPFTQNSGGAQTTFSWQGCNSTDPTEANPCVLGRRRALAIAHDSSVCLTATPAADVVTGLEGRTAFDAFTDMEMMAAPSEVALTVAALQVRARRAVGYLLVGI